MTLKEDILYVLKTIEEINKDFMDQEDLDKLHNLQERVVKAQIIELNKHIDSLKLTAAFSGNSTQDTGARQKVEQLIREIDKCIALMEE